MPITSTHPDYDHTIHRWTRVRDVRSGSDAVKARGEVYLPMLSGQDSDEYEAYKYRAMFLPVVSRTVRTLVGLAGVKRPELMAPEPLEDLAGSIGAEGEPLERVVADIMEELVSLGRVGALVDIGEDGITDSPPAIALYKAESIINWKFAKVDGRMIPVSVVLMEERPTQGEDQYDRKFETIYRELGFGMPPVVGETSSERMSFAESAYAMTQSEIEQGVYYQVIWSKEPEYQADGQGQKSKGDYIVEEVIVPRRAGGQALKEIPFRCFNAMHLGLSVGDVTMDDLATLNLSHYLNSADLEHGRHFTALPTAWLAGFEMKGELHIGSTRCWVAENPQAKAGFLEFSGAGLGHLQEGMEQKERLMAVVGVRFLEVSVQGPEKPESIRLRQQGDRATLVSIMDVVEDGIADLLEYCMMFMQAGDVGAEISFSMPRDVTETRLDPQLLANYISAVQSGLLSWESFIGILSSSNTLPDGVTAEEEARRLMAGIPGGMGMPGGEFDDEDDEPESEPELEAEEE